MSPSLKSFSWYDILTAGAIGACYGLLLLLIASNVTLPLSGDGILAVLFLLPLLGPLFLVVARIATPLVSSSVQIAKFVLVGALNTLLDLAILNLLLAGFHIHSVSPWYILIKAASFAVAVANSYVWNRYWVFKQANQPTKKEVLQFFSISAVGLCINAIVAWLVVLLLNSHVSSTIGANMGAITGTIVVLAWNFFGYKFIVFKV